MDTTGHIRPEWRPMSPTYSRSYPCRTETPATSPATCLHWSFSSSADSALVTLIGFTPAHKYCGVIRTFQRLPNRNELKLGYAFPLFLP